MKLVKYIIFIMLFIQAAGFAGSSGKKFSFILKENYTSSSRLYLSPKSADVVERNSSFAIDHIFSPAFEVRYLFSDQMSFGLNIEYISKTRKGIFVNVIENRGVVSVETEDGYMIIPVELSLFYQLPFSSDVFKVSIYGGGACYFGSHIRKIGNLSVSNSSRKFAYGIQVGTAFEYVMNRYFSFTGELKFRDPEVSLTTGYDNQTFNYGPRTLSTGRGTFDSKINIDGITYSFGIKISI